MTEVSRPWSGTVTGDAGPYTFDDWDDIFRTFQAPDRAIDGVFSEQLDELRYFGVVSPVTVERGRALVDGTWYESDVDITTAIPTPGANPRIDRLVLRKSWAAQTVRLTRIAGAEAASPVAPAITQTDGVTWDLPLFQVHITVGAVITLYRDERNFIGNYEMQGLRDNISYYEDEFEQRLLTFGVGDHVGRWRYDFDTEGSVGSRSGTDYIGAVFFTITAGAAAQQLIRSIGVGPVEHRLHWQLRASQANSDALVRVRVGWFNSQPTPVVPDPGEGIYFRINGAGNYFAVTRTGSVETATDTGIGSGAAWRRLEIRCSPDAIHFLIDAVLVATNDTNIPAGTSLFPTLGVVTTAAVAITEALLIDYERVTGLRTP